MGWASFCVSQLVGLTSSRAAVTIKAAQSSESVTVLSSMSLFGLTGAKIHIVQNLQGSAGCIPAIPELRNL